MITAACYAVKVSFVFTTSSETTAVATQHTEELQTDLKLSEPSATCLLKHLPVIVRKCITAVAITLNRCYISFSFNRGFLTERLEIKALCSFKLNFCSPYVFVCSKKFSQLNVVVV